jgi:catechol 2,3-dioxygenase-like lactoylglutathione lyase family enzyme
MSYVALATERFAEMARFYGEALGMPVVRAWDRPTSKGAVFDLGGGLRLEVLDAATATPPLTLRPVDGRCQLVIEVADLDAARRGLKLPTPEPVTASWGARLLRLHDPDGVAVWFLEWLEGGRAGGMPADPP